MSSLKTTHRWAVAQQNPELEKELSAGLGIPGLVARIMVAHGIDSIKEGDDGITMGRTQLQDAVPIRLGQVFHGYASMVTRDRKRIEKAHREMYTVNLGGTAVGTAINVSDFSKI